MTDQVGRLSHEVRMQFNLSQVPQVGHVLMEITILFGYGMYRSCLQAEASARGPGVASGAILGHVIATAIAVLGGAYASQYISEKTVGYIGGSLFLCFALATALGYF